MHSLTRAAGVNTCPIQSSFIALQEVKKLGWVFMSEYGKFGCLHLWCLNSWAEHGAALVGKSDVSDQQTLLNMFSLGKLTLKYPCFHCIYLHSLLNFLVSCRVIMFLIFLSSTLAVINLSERRIKGCACQRTWQKSVWDVIIQHVASSYGACPPHGTDCWLCNVNQHHSSGYCY